MLLRRFATVSAVAGSSFAAVALRQHAVCEEQVETPSGPDPPTDDEMPQRFLSERRVFLMSSIDDTSANRLVKQLLWLEADRPGAPIDLYINSSGGDLWGGFAVFDTMRAISSPVRTVCLGRCQSMAAMLLAAGEPGQRYACASSRLMIHQPSWGWGIFSGDSDSKQAEDLSIQATESQRQREHWSATLAALTGQNGKEIDARMARNVHLNAAEAKGLGLVDHILGGIEGGKVAAPSCGMA